MLWLVHIIPSISWFLFSLNNFRYFCGNFLQLVKTFSFLLFFSSMIMSNIFSGSNQQMLYLYLSDSSIVCSNRTTSKVYSISISSKFSESLSIRVFSVSLFPSFSIVSSFSIFLALVLWFLFLFFIVFI